VGELHCPADCADFLDVNQQSVLIVAIVPILDGTLIFEKQLSISL
jgi:hypothetical protein